MDALEFAKEKRRMCNTQHRNCYECELRIGVCSIGTCRGSDECDKRIIEFVEKWSKEHPKKTRQSELLKLFPNARIDKRGVIAVCPIALDAACGGCNEEGCEECLEKWWGEEIE